MTRDATTQAEQTDAAPTLPGLTRRMTVPVFALAVGASGYLVAACGSSGSDKASSPAATTDSDHGADETPTSAPTSASTTASGTEQELTSVSKVPAGGGVILADQKIVITKDSGGTIHAFSAVCTHQGCTVGSVSGGVIKCPCHGSRYDASTGKNIGGPAPSPLPAVAVTVRGDDIYKA
jgi:Rieske Fe-S protein